MTKEELKEAIASTIVENGQKAITAESLANLLNEIVDAVGESGGSGESGGGNGVLMLDLMGAEGPNENNVILRQTLMDGIANNKAYPVFFGFPQDEPTPESAIIISVPVFMYGYEGDTFVFLVSTGGIEMAITLNKDGSLEISM